MIPDRYVWLAWAASFLVPWLLLYALRPHYREAMWWMSLFTVPFGMSESLFLGRYWEPPTLFDLGRRWHFDLEAFVFCFAIGGVATVLYNAVAGKPLALRGKTEADMRRQALYTSMLVMPMPAFGAVFLATGEPIWAGITGMLAGAAARLVSRPDLAAKTGAGAVLFLVYYALFLLGLRALAPGYISRYWDPHGPAHAHVLGLPGTELFFAFAFGAYWSGLFEQLTWTLAWPGAPVPGARAAPRG